MEEEMIRIGDIIAIHPWPQDTLKLYAEGAGSWAVKVAVPDKSRQRDRWADLAFFRIEQCLWSTAAEKTEAHNMNLGEVVKNGDEIALRHLRTSAFFSVTGTREDGNLTFELSDHQTAETWIRATTSVHQDIGQPLRYSQPLCLVTQVVAVNHFVSVYSLDGGVTYNAYASAEEAYVVMRRVTAFSADNEKLQCHQIVALQHVKSGFLLSQEEDGKGKLTSRNPGHKVFWVFERLMEQDSGSLAVGEWYYLRNLSSGTYLTSSFSFVTQPGPNCALLLRCKTPEPVCSPRSEIFFETRDHYFWTSREGRPFYISTSYTEYYGLVDLEARLTASLVAEKCNETLDLFRIVPVSRGVSEFCRTLLDTAYCLRRLREVPVLEKVTMGVTRLRGMLESDGKELLTKQMFSAGIGAVAAAAQAASVAAESALKQKNSEEQRLVEALLDMLKVLVKKNAELAENVLTVSTQLMELLPLDHILIGRLLTSVFKQVDLHARDQSDHCRLWFAHLQPVDDANVLQQTQVLKLLKFVAEVRGVPSFSAQLELAQTLLWADSLVRVSEQDGAACVHFLILNPQAEKRLMSTLTADFVDYTYHALMLLAVICDLNYKEAIIAVQNRLGFTDKFLLSYQTDSRISAALRAALVHLSTVLVCVPAETNHPTLLRRPNNFVYTRAEIETGPQEDVYCYFSGAAENCAMLQLDFWRQRGDAENVVPRDALRLIFSSLQQVTFLVESGSVGPRFCSELLAAMLKTVLSLTHSEYAVFHSWPAEVLHRLVTAERESQELEVSEVRDCMLRALTAIVRLHSTSVILSCLHSESIDPALALRKHGSSLSLLRLFSIFTTDQAKAELDDVLLRLLFSCSDPSEQTISQALTLLSEEFLSNQIDRNLRRTVVLESQADMAVWQLLKNNIALLHPTHLRSAYSEPVSESGVWKHIQEVLIVVLHAVFPTQFQRREDAEKVQSMAANLGLLEIVHFLGSLLKDFHFQGFEAFWYQIVNIVVLCGVHCMKPQDIDLMQWRDLRPGIHFLSIPSSGLLIRELTNFEYLKGVESETVTMLLRGALNFEDKFARRNVSFLLYLQTDKHGAPKPEMQLVTSYRVVECINGNNLLERRMADALVTQLLQLLTLCCSQNEFVSRHLRSCFSTHFLSATAETHASVNVCQSILDLQSILYPDEHSEILAQILQRIQPLVSDSKLPTSSSNYYDKLAQYARQGMYTQAWPRKECALPHCTMRCWADKEDQLRLWEALLDEDTLKVETGFLVTVKRVMQTADQRRSAQVALEGILAGVKRLAETMPQLSFQRLESALTSLLAKDRGKKTDESESQTAEQETSAIITLLSSLQASAQSAWPTSQRLVFREVAQKLLEIDTFATSLAGRQRFAAAIRHLLTHCSSASMPTIFGLLQEVCYLIRDSMKDNKSDSDREHLQVLTNAIWTSSTLVAMALDGARSTSYRKLASLQLLAELTQDQTLEFQQWLLSVLKADTRAFPVLLLMRETFISALRAFAAERAAPEETVNIARLLLQFAQNATEGSYDECQRFFLCQTTPGTAEPSVDVVLGLADFVAACANSWGSEFFDEKMRRLGVMAIETLINLVTGPCLPTQRLLLLHGRLLPSLMHLIETLEAQGADPVAAAAEFHVSTLLNTLVEGDNDATAQHALLAAVDIPLLLAAIEKVFAECIAGRETQIAIEAVKDEGVMNRIHFAFGLYTFLLELREIDPTRAELRILTAFPEQKQNLLTRALRTIWPFRYNRSTCFGYFGSNVGYVELFVRGAITSVYFRIPPKCKYLSANTKEELVTTVRTTRQDVLMKVLLKVPQLEAEMSHQQRLARWPKFRALVRLWRPMLAVCFGIVVAIDFIFLITVEDSNDFRLQSSERDSDAIRILGAILAYASIVQFIAYMVEYYPKIVVSTGKYSSIDFNLYAFVPHCDSLLMVPWARFSEKTWIKRLPTFISSIRQLLFTRSSIARLLFIALAILGFIYPICYPFLLLWYMSTSGALIVILRAITENLSQLILTAAFCIIVMYAFAVILFTEFWQFFTEKGVRNSQYSLYCTDLYECAISTWDWGVRMGGGIGDPLAQTMSDKHDYSYRLALDTFFFMIVNIIILKIVFGIILDTFKELRERRIKSERDMAFRCFICRRTRNQLQHQGGGWTQHFLYEHSLFAYIAYIIYVNNRPPSRCSGIELYVKGLAAKSDPVFFPETTKYFQDHNLEFEDDEDEEK